MANRETREIVDVTIVTKEYRKKVMGMEVSSRPQKPKKAPNHETTTDSTSNPSAEYKCLTCDKAFHNKDNLNRHTLTHVTEKKFRCEFCSRAFANVYYLRRHIRVNHSELPYEVCPICKRIFRNRYTLKSHLWRHENSTKGAFKCEICDRSFPTDEKLSQHIEKTHLKSKELIIHGSDIEGYNCFTCCEQFSDQTELEAHMNLHTKGNAFLCKICKNSFNTKNSYKNHMKTHDEPAKGTEACFYCDKFFIDRRNHIMSVHKGLPTVPTDGPATCTICKKVFENLDTLKIHVVTHTKILYRCTTCHRHFSEMSDAHQHVFETHPGKSTSQIIRTIKKIDPPLIENSNTEQARQNRTKTQDESTKACFYCDKIFVDRHKRRNHIRSIHKGLPTFLTDGPPTCTVCKKVFENLDTLKKHVLTHTSILHLCTSCKKHFSAMSDAHQHVSDEHPGNDTSKIITTLKKIVPPRIRNSNTDQPVATKPNENLFECAMCPRKCKLKTNLANHMSVHLRTEKKVNVKPKSGRNRTLKCVRCKDTFKDQKTLLAHAGSCKQDTIWYPIPNSTTEYSVSDIVNDPLASDMENWCFDPHPATYTVPVKNDDHNYAYMGT